MGNLRNMRSGSETGPPKSHDTAYKEVLPGMGDHQSKAALLTTIPPTLLNVQ